MSHRRACAELETDAIIYESADYPAASCPSKRTGQLYEAALRAGLRPSHYALRGHSDGSHLRVRTSGRRDTSAPLAKIVSKSATRNLHPFERQLSCCAINLLTCPNHRCPTADVETFYIRKGANGTLPCLPVLPADSQATMNKIEWFKEDKKLVEAEAKHIVVWNTKNTIAYLPETGSLLFRGVGNEDSGEYHCLLTKQSSGETEDGIVRFYVQGK